MASSKRERQKELHRAKLEDARAAERRAQIIRRVVGVAIAVVVVVGFGILVNVLQDDDDADVATGDDLTETSDPDEGTTETSGPEMSVPVFEYGTTPCAGEDAERQIDFESPFEDCIDPEASYAATFETNMGTIEVALDTERTPGTTNNFVNLARHGYYDDTVIFRTDGSIDIVQGGSPHTQDNADPGPGYTITDEGGEFDAAGTQGPFTYEPGQLVMARSQGPNSAGAQYFFTVGPDSSLLDSQGTYVVFGEVTEGLDVLEEMLALEDPDDPGVPTEEIRVESVTISQS